MSRFNWHWLHKMAEGRGEWLMMLFSLFLAISIWTIHNLSMRYTTYLQYSIKAKTNIEGRVMEAVSEDAVMLRARSTGYYLLIHRLDEVVNVDLEPRYFHPISPNSDTFVVNVSEIKSVLEKSLLEKVQSVESYTTENIRFIFHRVETKKVPIVAQSEITYSPQYMATSEMKLSPDSVLIYGKEGDIEMVDAVYTRIISNKKVKEGIQGFVSLIPIQNVTISQTQILYSQDVGRYVERTIELPVESINVPDDKELLVLNSRVTLKFRELLSSHHNLNTHLRDFSNDFKCVVDYNDIKNSINNQVMPTLILSPSGLYDVSFDPPYLDCIVLDK